MNINIFLSNGMSETVDLVVAERCIGIGELWQ